MVGLDEAAKPILILLILIPLRVTLGGRSWLADLIQGRGSAGLRLARLLALGRVSPAVADVTFALVATRVATISIAFIGNLLFAPYGTRSFTLPFERLKFAEVFAAWDSGWYFDIASRGYYFNADGQSSIAFFPLYPLLMRAVAWPFGGTDRAIWVAGIVVSSAAFALALLAVHRLTQQLFGDREVARRDRPLPRAVSVFALFHRGLRGIDLPANERPCGQPRVRRAVVASRPVGRARDARAAERDPHRAAAGADGAWRAARGPRARAPVRRPAARPRRAGWLLRVRLHAFGRSAGMAVRPGAVGLLAWAPAVAAARHS